jgi:hypothetical protein
LKVVTIGGFNTTTEACKLVWQELANENNVQTIQRALNSGKFGGLGREKAASFTLKYYC